MQKGTSVSEVTRAKMREAALKRNNDKRIASLPRGTKHWNWSDKPNKLTLHKRLYRKFGSAKEFTCARCSKAAHDWANVTGNYTDERKDYLPMCRSCHVKLDKNWLSKYADMQDMRT